MSVTPVDAASGDGLSRRRFAEKRSRRRQNATKFWTRWGPLEPQPREGWSSATSPSGARGLRVIGKVAGKGHIDLLGEAEIL